MQREHARGGQVYFLHNDVADDREDRARTRRADAGGAHPPRPRPDAGARTRADRCSTFYRQRFNVLVATTIIESGIDVPSANTIIINRADRFGLAQLHQLRGRVGRSHHRAYAYLMMPEPAARSLPTRRSAWRRSASLGRTRRRLHPGHARPGDPRRRRTARRGAERTDRGGRLLLYTELLDRAVRALKHGKVPDFDLASEHEAEVELHLPALIPTTTCPTSTRA